MKIENIVICLLLNFFSSINLIGQNFAGFYHNKNEFCSNSIFLTTDSLAFFEGGCEGRSYVDFGIWSAKNDTLSIREWDNDLEYNPIKKIQLQKEKSDTTGIFIFDLNGENITKTQLIKIHASSPDTSFITSIDKIIEGKYIYRDSSYNNFFIDNESIKLINYNITQLELIKLDWIFNKSYPHQIEPNCNIKIFLNFPRMILWAPEITRSKNDYKDYKLILKEDGFYRNGKKTYSKPLDKEK